MANKVNQLSAKKIEKALPPGMYIDGGGLYLQVTSRNAKSWIFRYSLKGKAREMGLGSLRKVSLAQARREVASYHFLLKDHIDPIAERNRRRAANALANAKTITFREAADAYCAAHRVDWKNPKHAAQWRTTLAQYAEPKLGKLMVRDIDTDLMHQILDPIWTSKPETATRVRGRVEAVLDWAAVKGYRAGENPARWRGNLDNLLPKQSRERRVKHHAALPYTDLPAFLAALRKEEGTAARALEFCILTAARTGEVLGAKPCEISRAEKLWTVPAARMKLHREHRVPLSASALQLCDWASASYIFPSPQHPDKSLSNMAMLMTLDRMGYGHVTVHGFRSTFKDWARDRTRFDNYVVEAALAHSVGDKIEAAYARSDVLDKRRKLMDAWAAFCASSPVAAGGLQSNVTRLRAS